MSKLCICMRLENQAISQYTDFDFHSFCEFNGEILGANETGLYVLDKGDFNDIRDIEAFFEIFKTDLGTQREKRIRFMYFGVEMSGNLIVKVTFDDGEERSYTIDSGIYFKQQGLRKAIDRVQRGIYVSVKVENDNGGDFSLDSIGIIPTILRGSYGN